jgi:uncharacterized protein
MRGVLFMLGIAAVLASCGSSPPTRFYTLDAVKPQGPAPGKTAALPVKVDAVHIPALLDRRAIVRRQAGNQLDISSQDRWGASFGEMARGVLTQDLQSRMAPGAILPHDAPAPRDARGLVVDILSFVPNGSGQVVLSCDWALLEGAPAHTTLLRTVYLSQPAGDSPSSQADAMSELLGKLADQIAATLSTQALAGEPHE